MLASSCQRCFRRKIRYGVRRVMMLSSSSSSTTTTAASRSSTVVAENSASSSSSSGGGLGLLSWYSKTIDAYPLLTKCITAGIVSGAGDLASQKLLKKQQQEVEKGSGGGNDDIDLMQTLRFVCMNVFFVGPTLHYWYLWLARRYPGKSISSVVKRVIWDEFIFTPFYYPVFLTILWKLEQGATLSMDKITNMLYHEMPTLIFAEWIIYVPTQAINFRFVPLKYQVLFSNVIGIVWNGFLSWTAQHAQNKHLPPSKIDEKKEHEQNPQQMLNNNNKMDLDERSPTVPSTLKSV